MTAHLLYFFFLLLKASLLHCKSIESYYIVLYGQYHIRLSIGERVQKITRAVQQTLPYTWLSEYHYISPVPLFYNDNVTINGEAFKAEVITERINLKNEENIDFFKFYLVGNYDIYNKYTDGYSFALKFINDSFSIIHLLYQHNVISKKAYGIIPTNNFNGMFIYGEIPIERKKKYLYSSILYIKEDYVTWGNDLYYIYVGEHLYEYDNRKNSYAYFHSGSKWISVSKEYWNFMVENVFKDLIRVGICSVQKQKVNYVLCKEKLLPELFKISFQFENFTFCIPMKKLFECKRTFCDFQMTYDENNIKNIWSFGISFLNLFTTEFDYDSKSITFHTKTNEYINVNTKVNKSTYKLMLVTIFLIFLGIINNLLGKLTINKNI